MADFTSHFPPGYFTKEPSYLSPFFALVFLPPLTAFSIPSSFPVPTSAPRNRLSTLSFSSRRQRKVIRFPSFCRRPTPTRLVLALISELIKQVPSIPFTPFAYEHILSSQVQSYSTLTAQISHFILHHFGTHSTHTLPPLLTGRAFHFWTAVPFRTPPCYHYYCLIPPFSALCLEYSCPPAHLSQASKSIPFPLSAQFQLLILLCQLPFIPPLLLP